MSINKNGTVTSESFIESDSQNILNNAAKYARPKSYTLTGKSGDIIKVTDMYARVTPGETYYYLASCSPGWADGHGYTEARKGKCTIWLYLLKEYDSSNGGYDTAILFNSASSTKIQDGIWKYTIPSGYNMARVRFNTYSDGEEEVAVKFWDIKLIPEAYYVSSIASVPSAKLGGDYLAAQNIMEI